MTGRWEFVDTKDIAHVLYNNGLLTYAEFCRLTNVQLDQVDRMNDLLYKMLPSKGREQNTLISFYQCLLKCYIDRNIPTELRAHGKIMWEANSLKRGVSSIFFFFGGIERCSHLFFVICQITCTGLNTVDALPSSCSVYFNPELGVESDMLS